jgi:hypothetical protein
MAGRAAGTSRYARLRFTAGARSSARRLVFGLARAQATPIAQQLGVLRPEAIVRRRQRGREGLYRLSDERAPGLTARR